MKKSLQERVDNLYRLITEADDTDNADSDSDGLTIKTLNSLYRSIINKQEPASLDGLIRGVIKNNKPGTESILLQLIILKSITVQWEDSNS